ncbi:MAG: hypothetical protein K6G17_06240 [Oscillospiraceae bacterium]|nr:hypothetical protein [Oscillospiraceae bacterium]
MKTLKRLLALLLAILLLLSLSACAGKDEDDDEDEDRSGSSTRTSRKKEEKTVYEIAEITQRSEVSYQDGSETVSVVLYSYSEQGLITSVETEIDGEERTVEITYQYDDRGTVSGFSGEIDGAAVEVTIENVYSGSRVTEAVISDVVLDGESLKDRGALDTIDNDSSMVQLSMLLTAKRFVQNYIGYRDSTVRVGDTGLLSRFEDGKLVYDYMRYPGFAQETINEYDKGKTTTTVNTYNEISGEKKLTVGIITIINSKNQIVSVGGQVPDFVESIIVDLRFEEERDEETGDRIALSYIDEDSVRCVLEEFEDELGDVEPEEIDEMLAMLHDYPLVRYTLDEKGKVIKTEILVYQLMNNGQTNTTWYDEDGRVVRTESGTNIGNYKTLTVTETKYR